MKIGLLVGGLFLALLVAAVVVVDITRIPDMYSVRGEAEIKYMPDTATITAGVIQTADTSTDAIQTVADGMSKVLDALKAAGVPDADIATRSVETHVVLPDHDSEPKKPPHLYYAAQMIEVKLHDLSLVSKIASVISDSGSNQWRVSYSVADDTKLKDAAAKAAFEDAIKKADIYAAAGGFKRGRLLKLSDSQVNFPTMGYDENNYTSAGLEEIIVTARRREEQQTPTKFSIPKPKEESVSADVTLLLATR
jgi:uncharacterized protein YggE